jgi:acetyl esterase/lipase
MRRGLFVLLLVFICGVSLPAEDGPIFTRDKDIIYGRKFGMALTLDAFKPARDANGLGIIFVVSGGWFSSEKAMQPMFVEPYLKRGYTVFMVLHGSQPKFTLPEIIEDIHRAVRWVRFNAKNYNIDPEKLGITGASAGGHLSLMMAAGGKDGDPKAADPIDRQSSRVKAAAVFFPPTDFLNYGEAGKEYLAKSFRPPFTAATDYHEFDKSKALYLPVTDPDKQREIARAVSPITHVSEKTAACLLIHGDKDTLVPIQQSEVFVKKVKEAKVPAKLIVREGAEHGWRTLQADIELFADWFDEHLAGKKPAPKP